MQGLILIDQVARVPGAEIRAVCDIWPYSQRYATGRIEAYGKKAAVYADYREMLAREKGLDAAIIATPDFCHAEQAAACLAAGLHVYCEEPMAPTAKEARDMVAAARAAKRLLAGGLPAAVQPAVPGRRRITSPRRRRAGPCWPSRPSGTACPGPAADGRATRPCRRRPSRSTVTTRWTGSATGCGSSRSAPGPMSRLGGRQLDALNWLLGGPPRAVLATAARHSAAKTDWPDAYGVLLEWDLPAEAGRRTVIGRYQILQGSSHLGFCEAVTGTEGCLRVSEAQPPARLIRETDANLPDWEMDLAKHRLEAMPEMLASGGLDPDEDEFYVQPPSYALPPTRDYLLPVAEQPFFQPHLENFFQAIRKGTPLACPGEAGYQALVTALAVNQAVESGKRVELKAEDFKV